MKLLKRIFAGVSPLLIIVMVLSFGLKSCSSTSSGGSWTVTVQTNADWAVCQVESGPWQLLKVGTANGSPQGLTTYTFEVHGTGRYGVAMKCNASDTVKIYQLTAEETELITWDCAIGPADTFAVAGTISNNASDAPIQVSAGDQVEIVAPGATRYRVLDVEKALWDLVAMEAEPSAYEPERILFYRDLRVDQDLDHVDLDFEDSVPWNAYALSAVGGEAGAFMVTRNGTSVPGVGSTEDGKGFWFRPATGIVEGDRTVFVARDDRAQRERIQVLSTMDLSSDYRIDLTPIAGMSGVTFEKDTCTFKGLAFTPDPESPELRGFEISQSRASTEQIWQIFVSKGWLGRDITTYTVPDFSNVEGWDTAYQSVNGDGTSTCATVAAVMANKGLDQILSGQVYPSGLDLARTEALVCETKENGRSWTVSEELKSAMTYAIPKILRDELITDQPLIYIFSTYEPLPAGTVIAPYEDEAAFDTITLDKSLLLLYLEPSAYEDVGHPVRFFLVDLSLEEFIPISSVAPPTVDGTLFMEMAQQPLLSVFSPVTRGMESESQEEQLDQRETKYEIVIYFEGANGDYHHCAIGINIIENGKVTLQRIYDNHPANPAHGPYNKNIGQYTSFYEYALQVYGEKKSATEGYGVSMVSIPVKADAAFSLVDYFNRYFQKEPYCKIFGCEVGHYIPPFSMCTTFVKDGIHVALPGVVEWWPGLVEIISTPNSIFSVLSLHYSTWHYPFSWLSTMFGTECICYGKTYIADVNKWKYWPLPDESPCNPPDGSTVQFCQEYQCVSGMCQSGMLDEYQACLNACKTPHKLGCGSPCTGYCSAFKTHIFRKGCGKYAGEKAPTDFSYKCRDLPKLGIHHAVKCTLESG